MTSEGETWLNFEYGPGMDPTDTRDEEPPFHVRHKTERHQYAQSGRIVVTFTKEEADEQVLAWGEDWEAVLGEGWTTERKALPGYMGRRRRMLRSGGV